MGNGVGKALAKSVAWIAEGPNKSSKSSKINMMRNVKILRPFGFNEKQVKDIHNFFKRSDTRNTGKIQAATVMEEISFGRAYGLRLFCPIGRDEDEDESSSDDSSDDEEDGTNAKIQTKRVACPTVRDF